MLLSEELKGTIRDIPDYPRKGINFKDITPILAKPKLVHAMIDKLVKDFSSLKIDAVAGTEARGFILAPILAFELNCAFIPVRKKGKLPYKSVTQEYDLEYGSACIEMHVDAIQPGWRVLVHDDLLATGGTAGATGELVRKLGGEVVAFSFLINLSFLQGEKTLIERFGIEPHYLVSY
jgi:adenine phosphoribosyltransferase